MSNINKLKIGRYIQQPEGWKSFTPYGFPPKGGFDITPRLYKKHEEAIRLVGKLDGIMRFLPDKDYFLQMFVNKDAALSSQRHPRASEDPVRQPDLSHPRVTAETKLPHEYSVRAATDP